MTNYTIKMTAQEATINELPEIYVYFGHNEFAIVWDEQTGRQEVKHGVDTFFGGNMGEGSRFDTWQDALHSSLYDLYQVEDRIKDGDVFTASYNGESQTYVCSDAHVVKFDA